MVKKPAKTTPTEKFDPKKIKKLQAHKAVDRMEGQMDQNIGKDTKMSRDGGTTRRVRR